MPRLKERFASQTRSQQINLNLADSDCGGYRRTMHSNGCLSSKESSVHLTVSKMCTCFVYSVVLHVTTSTWEFLSNKWQIIQKWKKSASWVPISWLPLVARWSLWLQPWLWHLSWLTANQLDACICLFALHQTRRSSKGESAQLVGSFTKKK